LIVVVSSTSEPSGVVSYLAAAAELLDPSAFAYVVVPHSELDRSLPADVLRISTNGTRRDIARLLANARRDFSFVQTHGRRGLLAARQARVPKRRLGHVFHETPRVRSPRTLAETVIAAGADLAGNAPHTAQKVSCLLRRPTAVLCPVVRPGAYLNTADARRELGLADGDISIGVVGRLHRAKEPMRAMRAARELPRELRAAARLVFVGDGPEAPSLREAAGKSDVRVELVGRVADARRLVRGFDVLVSPSRFESFGLAMAEAAAARVPVAAVSSPGARLLSYNGASFPVCAPDPKVLAKAIAAALRRTEEQWAAVSEATLSRFGPEAAAASYQRYYEHLLARR
jgi:glycosyltransferase involved in cell wall biosynthesis